MINKFIDWTERGYVPDSLLRMGIRRLLKKRLAQADAGSPSANASQTESLVEEFDQGPIALVPELANIFSFSTLKLINNITKYQPIYSD